MQLAVNQSCSLFYSLSITAGSHKTTPSLQLLAYSLHEYCRLVFTSYANEFQQSYVISEEMQFKKFSYVATQMFPLTYKRCGVFKCTKYNLHTLFLLAIWNPLNICSIAGNISSVKFPRSGFWSWPCMSILFTV